MALTVISVAARLRISKISELQLRKKVAQIAIRDDFRRTWEILERLPMSHEYRALLDRRLAEGLQYASE